MNKDIEKIEHRLSDIVRKNEDAIKEEAVRGDKSAIEDYDKALTETMMPPRLKEIIRTQREKLHNDIQTTDILEDYR